MGVYLIGMHFMGVHLTGVYLTRVYLFQVCISYRRMQLVSMRILIFGVLVGC